jgi:hypothetical protein
MVDTELDYRMLEALEHVNSIERVVHAAYESVGCYWHDIVGCECGEPNVYSDAEGEL